LKISSRTITQIKDATGVRHVATKKKFHLAKASETDSAPIVAFQINFTSMPQISSAIHALNAAEPVMRTLNSSAYPGK